MDVTLPDDHCFSCHSDVAKERPSHKDFDPKGCASSGCHNYHDNKALYEDFLAAHLHEPDTKQPALLPQRNLSEQQIIDERKKPLAENEQNAPTSVQLAPDQLKAWAGSAHGKEGINCSDCHQTKSASGQPEPWKNQLDYKACEDCHKHETKGFIEGKHGMRLSQGLPPMKPSMARLPMKEEAHDKTLSCTSCHDVHTFDTRRAAVESCLGCHDDNHSRTYKQSPHFRLWLDEADGKGEKGSGVSCATCHLPRDTDRKGGRTNVHVEHNQSMNLHPNEKMVRGVCMQCHGLGFSLDALSDDALIRNNFNGKPTKHVKSLDMAEERLRLKSEQKTSTQTP
jgi:mono/diheme cytochrome c family protein